MLFLHDVNAALHEAIYLETPLRCKWQEKLSRATWPSVKDVFQSVEFCARAELRIMKNLQIQIQILPTRKIQMDGNQNIYVLTPIFNASIFYLHFYFVLVLFKYFQTKTRFVDYMFEDHVWLTCFSPFACFSLLV